MKLELKEKKLESAPIVHSTRDTNGALDVILRRGD